jgi:hypothetical protein
MFKFIDNNSERIILGLVIAGLLFMAAGIGYNFRGGNDWAYSHPTGATVEAATK